MINPLTLCLAKNKLLKFETKEKNEKIYWEIKTLNNNKYVSVVFPTNIKNNTIGIAESQVICQAFRLAGKLKYPIVIEVISGGMKITEGTIALMQMPKLVLAAKRHGALGLLFIAIIHHPTLGGASASFVALADIIIGEQGSSFGFCGRRVIEKTINTNLETDCQEVSKAKQNGLVDIVVKKKDIIPLISTILMLHRKKRWI